MYFILSINSWSSTTIVQVVIEVSEADASAAAQIQMNTALSMMSPAGVQPTVAEVDGDTDEEEEEEEGDGQFEGVMSQAEIDSLSKRERKAYFDAVSTLVATAGEDAYTFVTPFHVRCSACAKAEPAKANCAKPRGKGNCEAILFLSQGKFNVSSLTYTGYKKNGDKSTRQPGHHHLAHGCCKDAKDKSEAGKAATATVAVNRNLRAWKLVYKPQTIADDPLLAKLSQPGIKLIRSYIKTANTPTKHERGVRGWPQAS